MSGRFFTEIFRPQQGKRQQIRQTIQRIGPKFPHRPQQLRKGAEKQYRAAQGPQHQEPPQLAVGPPQQKQEADRGRQLQKELAPGCQALVLVVAQLLIVVQKPDGAEHQREQQAENVTIVAPQHAAEADRQAHDSDGGNEHHAAHGGRAVFGHVPRGAVRLDALPCLNPAQERHQKHPDPAGYDKCDHKRQNQLQRHFCFLFSSISATISRSSMWIFVLPMI